MDLRYAIRLLAKTPRFTALSLSVLVGGLFVSLFTFSVVNTAVYKSLPLPEGKSIFNIGSSWGRLPSYEFLEIRNQVAGLAEQGVWKDVPIRLSLGDTGVTLEGSVAETNIFDFARTPVLRGRGFQRQDSRLGAEPVTVISYRVWQGVFDADPEILGRSLLLENRATVVVGVMPEGFNFPVSTDIWLPMSEEALSPAPESRNQLNAYARLAPGTSREALGSELTERIDRLFRDGVRIFDKPDHRLVIFLESFQGWRQGVVRVPSASLR